MTGRPEGAAGSPGALARQFAEYEATLDCIHCGLCIPDCPTHNVTGREADSPRGRIHLMRGWAEGRMDLSPAAHAHLDACIVCRACESVCPSGIRMGDMMETFRAERNASHPSGIAASRVGRYLLRHVLPDRAALGRLARLLGVYERSGLSYVASRLLPMFAPGLAHAHRLRPRADRHAPRPVPTDRQRPDGFPAIGKRRARVALFVGCVASEWFAAVNHATIRVLQHNGCDVVIPDAQTCCGALHRHAGLLEEASALLSRNAEAFAATEAGAGVDAVIVNAAGCGASLKESAGAAHVPYRDITEFLHELGLTPPTHRVARRVAYDAPCHLLHAQRVDVAEELLAQIPDLELVPLAGRERCCGAGGIFNLLRPDMSEPILDEKVSAILESGAEVLATGNPGCALQIRHGLEGRGIDVCHPVELLDRGYGGA